MGDIKNLLIGLAIVGFVAIVVALFMAGNGDKYGVTNTNTSKITDFNKLTEVNQISENIKIESEKNSSSSTVDLFLAYFKLGWNSVKLTKSSIDITNDMIDKGTDKQIIGSSGDALKIFLITLVIFLVIGALLYILLGREW